MTSINIEDKLPHKLCINFQDDGICFNGFYAGIGENINKYKSF